jgi:hypothetical protein
MKIGRRRKYNGNWQLYIRDIPKELGDALDALWRKQVEDAVVAHVKPLGWHAWLLSLWRYYVEGELRKDKDR